MSDKKTIAVRTCGGCVCKFDRRKVIKTLTDGFADSCTFRFNYDLEKDGEFDLALLICGCESACAPHSETIENLIIDHTNWETATGVFGEWLAGAAE